MLGRITEDRIARLVNHVSELVVKVKRVNWGHETPVARSRDRDGFFAHSTREITSCWKSKQSLYLCAVSRE